MDGLFFNHAGLTHGISVSCVDGVSVWRGVVDDDVVVFWDSGLEFVETDLLMVFRGLVDAYVEEVG